MAYISESICKISKQRQDNYNDYYFYPQKDDTFKKEAFEDKIVIVKIFNANNQLIDEFNINVNNFWKSNTVTQIRTTTRNGQDVSKKYNNSKIFAFPKRYIDKFDINTFFNNIKYWLYSAGEKSYKWDEFYKDGIMAIGWDYLGDLTKYSSQAEIADKITKEESKTEYPKNDSKANWEFAKEMQVGDIVYVKKGLQDALIGRGIVKSDYIYDTNRNEYKSTRKVDWTHNGTYDVDFNVLDIKQWNQKTLTEISQSKYKDFCLKIEDVFMKKQLGEKSNNSQVNIPLNQILYGPPGTGKTFSVGEYITDIVRQNPGLKADNEEQRINDVVRDLSWYSAIGLSMYQNGKHKKYKVADLMEQKIIKVFSLTRENKNIRAALWAQMQMHTPSDCQTVNYTNRQAPFIFEKNNNSEWSLTEDGIRFIEENLADQLEFLNAKNSQRKIEDFYKFITFHQSYSYEEFIEGIKPKINNNDDDNSTISYEYNRGIFKEICQQANSEPSNNN